MQELDRQHGIPNVAKFEIGQGGLTRLVITGASSAEIYLHGAHVTHFQPAGQKPVLWVSKKAWFAEGKPIRGGVPLCFPWFGGRASDPGAPAHGFARLLDWSVESVTRESDGTVVATLFLEAGEQTRGWWPVDFMARFSVRVGPALEMMLAVTNRSDTPISFEEAMHSYFAVSDVKQIGVSGLGGAPYLHRVGTPTPMTQTDPVIRFTAETDRNYNNNSSTCVIDDPGWSRKIEIAKRGSNSTVVWNPWIAKSKAMVDYGDDEWPEMVCVESANITSDTVVVAPAATHEMTTRISVK